MSMSLAFAVRRLDIPRTIDSVSTAGLGAEYERSPHARQVSYPGRMDVSGKDRTGIAFNQDSGDVVIKGPGSEMTMTDQGIHMEGSIINNDMNRKSLFNENPLGYIIPETIVTFPVSFKYMPSLNIIDNIGSMMQTLNDVKSLIKSARDL
jgi:hypothetical protein